MALDNSQQPQAGLTDDGTSNGGPAALKTTNPPMDLQPLEDDLIKHRVFIQRLQGSQTQNIKDYLDQMKKVTLQQIRSGSTFDLQAKLRGIMKPLSEASIQSMGDLAEYESKFSAKVFNKHMNTDVQPVDRAKLDKALSTTNMDINHLQDGNKKSLKVAYNQFGNRKADEIAQIVKDGYKGKLSDLDIARQVTSKIDGLHMAQAKSLSSGSINFAVNLARLNTIKDSDELENKYMWISTLENPCDDCESNHGEIMDIGDDVPPLHYNCKCDIAPVEVSNKETKAPDVETTNNTFNQNLDITNGAGNDAED